MGSLELLVLAERVEALTGPDREMDYEIADAVLGRIRPPFRRGHCEKYTASFDAAMTLKPDGWHVGCVTECNEENQPHACLTENTEPCRDAVGNGIDMITSLCAAAIRARASTPDEKGEG